MFHTLWRWLGEAKGGDGLSPITARLDPVIRKEIMKYHHVINIDFENHPDTIIEYVNFNDIG